MLAIERRNAILSKLASDGKVIVSDLSQEFNVTEETIRRDLEKLDNEGLAKNYGAQVGKTLLSTVKVRNTENAVIFRCHIVPVLESSEIISQCGCA